MDDDFKDMIRIVANNPEMIPHFLEMMIGKYEPIVGETCNSILNIYEKYINDFRHYELSARDKWNEYQSLLGVGFSEDQAMMLLLNRNSEYNKTITNSVKNITSKINSD